MSVIKVLNLEALSAGVEFPETELCIMNKLYYFWFTCLIPCLVLLRSGMFILWVMVMLIVGTI